jgi:hypothetical protein
MVFATFSHFLPSLILTVEARSLPLERSSILARRNTLAYYDTAIVTAVKSFIVQAPGGNVTKVFTVVINGCSNQTRVFVRG